MNYKERFIYDNGEDFFRIAAKRGNLEIVQWLCENGIDIRADNDFAVRWSMRNGHLEIAKYLVKKGADISADNDWAIECAERNGRTEVIEYIKSVSKL